MTVRTAFLGSGYTGAHFARLYPSSLHTSRRPERCTDERAWRVFDASRPTTWQGVASWGPDAIVVGLPLQENRHLPALTRFLIDMTPRVVVIGTTSSLVPEHGEVTDTARLRSDDPRAAAEETLREAGATVLHSAGIYGPGRNPLDWVRRGRIASAGKLVNLVHVEDLARACAFLLEGFSPGERLVISDGCPRRWREIIDHASARGWLTSPHLAEDAAEGSKRVLPRLLGSRGFALAHPDLLAELDLLEAT